MFRATACHQSRTLKALFCRMLSSAHPSAPSHPFSSWHGGAGGDEEKKRNQPKRSHSATNMGWSRKPFVRSRPEQESSRFRQKGIRSSGGAWARRKPRLLLRLPDSFLSRFADRQFLGSLFQDPPRRTRFYRPCPYITYRHKRAIPTINPQKSKPRHFPAKIACP